MTTTTTPDRKSTRLNSSHTVIYTLSLHDALPIFTAPCDDDVLKPAVDTLRSYGIATIIAAGNDDYHDARSEEHTSELQSHSDLHSFPTRRSSDLHGAVRRRRVEARRRHAALVRHRHHHRGRQ